MLKVLSEPSATAVTTAAFTGIRLGELRGLTWESYEPARDEESLGWRFQLLRVGGRGSKSSSELLIRQLSCSTLFSKKASFLELSATTFCAVVRGESSGSITTINAL